MFFQDSFSEIIYESQTRLFDLLRYLSLLFCLLAEKDLVAIKRELWIG